MRASKLGMGRPGFPVSGESHENHPTPMARKFVYTPLQSEVLGTLRSEFGTCIWMGRLQIFPGWAARTSEIFSPPLACDTLSWSNHSVHSTSGQKAKSRVRREGSERAGPRSAAPNAPGAAGVE